MTKTVKVATIEPYSKELKRKEFKDTPYRIFKHPNSSSIYIVSKNGIVIGVCALSVIKRTFREARYMPKHAFKDFEDILIEFNF